MVIARHSKAHEPSSVGNHRCTLQLHHCKCRQNFVEHGPQKSLTLHCGLVQAVEPEAYAAKRRLKEALLHISSLRSAKQHSDSQHDSHIKVGHWLGATDGPAARLLILITVHDKGLLARLNSPSVSVIGIG